jgi:fructosamine-3-kinase
MTLSDDQLAGPLSAALGRPVRLTGRRRLGGGSISETTRIETSAGSFVVKSHPNPPEGFFEAEAAGLAALRRAATRLVVPRVILCATAPLPLLVLEDLGAGAPADDFDQVLGAGLAEVHRAGSDRYGFDRGTFCGTTPQSNGWRTGWVPFYADARLLPQIRAARDAGRLAPGDAERLNTLVARLDRWIADPSDGPSLIHGDLWTGNAHVTGGGRPALLDPSVSYAHREAELGMMTLFGGFPPDVFSAYDEAFPLEPGWRERNPLYQLYHLLNHLNLFGGGYRHAVMTVVHRYV